MCPNVTALLDWSCVPTASSLSATYVACYFRDVYLFVYFIIAMYVHHLGSYCILFRRFLISKINVALQLTKLWLNKVTTTTTTTTTTTQRKAMHMQIRPRAWCAMSNWLFGRAAYCGDSARRGAVRRGAVWTQLQRLAGNVGYSHHENKAYESVDCAEIQRTTGIVMIGDMAHRCTGTRRIGHSQIRRVKSQNLWPRYDRHFVGITWHNVWS